MRENDRLGKYKLMGVLGQGGEGCVYLAKDESLSRLVAVKRLWADGEKGNDWEKAESGLGVREIRAGGEELMREAAFLRDLRHPALPVVYELFYEDGWYLAMEYIAGISLHKYIRDRGPVEEEQARLWSGVLLEVLSYLHTRETSVIYRDLRPDNIIVCGDGSVRLVDFGAAAFRSFGEKGDRRMACTPGFAAPEQLKAAGKGVWADERSDIYAFGKVLYYMVTGADPGAAPYAELSPSCYNPLLSAELEEIIARCTAEEPEARYQVVAEIIRDMKHGMTRRGRRRRAAGKREFVRHVEKQVYLAAAGNRLAAGESALGYLGSGREMPI